MMLNLVQHLDRDLFTPKFALVQHKESPPGEQMVRDVLTHNFGKRHASQAMLPLSHLLRRDSPDLLFSVQDHVNVVALLARQLSGTRVKTVISVRTTPSMACKADSNVKNRLLIPFLMRRLYPSADRLVALSEGIAQDARNVTGIPESKIEVIYSPIVDERLETLSKEPVDHPWFSGPIPTILAVGRLSEEKGFSYLLRATARVLRERPVRLVIVGEGQERRQLENLAQELGIAPSTALIGYRENPYKYMARASVFVLSSLWEGLPAVVVEAMACGAPVVATDCPSGPSEIITSSTEGILVPPADPEALAQGILKVLSDRGLCRRMQTGGKARAQDFHVRRIAERYQRFFLETLGED